MKASKLVKEIERMILLAGDWEILAENSKGWYNIKGVHVIDENELGIELGE